MGLAFIILAALGGVFAVRKHNESKQDRSNVLEETKKTSNTGYYDSTKLDKGISSDESTAIRWALAHETDGVKLREFGQVMLPDFPIASATLLAKSGSVIYRDRPASMIRAESAVKTASMVKQPKISPIAHVSIANIHGIGDLISGVGDTLGDAVQGVTHPADTLSDAVHIATHPADSISDFANGVISVVHQIPGMDELGEQLKDFANTGVGEWSFRVIATYAYYASAGAASPIIQIGAITVPSVALGGLAPLWFALPGAVKGDPVIEAWIKETMDRAIKTINIVLKLSGTQLPDEAGTMSAEAIKKFLDDNPGIQDMVNKMTEQVNTATNAYIQDLGTDLISQIKAGSKDALLKLAGRYGMPPDFSKIANQLGIQEVNAAAAYDLIAGTNYQGTIDWDASTGQDILAHMKKQRLTSVQNVSKDTRGMSSAESLINSQYRKRRPLVVAYYLKQAKAGHG